MEDLTRFLKNSHLLGWVAIFSLFLPIPILNFFAFGWTADFAHACLTENNFTTPKLENARNYFARGGRVFLLILLVFSPALICFLLSLIFALPVFSYTNFSNVSPLFLFYHALFVLFLGILTGIFSLLITLFVPISFLRFIEGNDFLWAVKLQGILEDLNQMGSSYWGKLLTAFSLFFIGCVFLSFFYTFTNLFGIRYFIPEIVSGYLFCFLSLFCILLLIQSTAPFYRELHYHY